MKEIKLDTIIEYGIYKGKTYFEVLKADINYINDDISYNSMSMYYYYSKEFIDMYSKVAKKNSMYISSIQTMKEINAEYQKQVQKELDNYDSFPTSKELREDTFRYLNDGQNMDDIDFDKL